MIDVSLDYSALHYLRQWLERDSRYYAILNSRCHHRRKRLALLEAATFYRVARNLPGSRQQDPEALRYQPVVDMLGQLRRFEFERDTVGAVLSFSNELQRRCKSKKGMLSLSTKVLWLKRRSPIIIYDSLARKGLGIPNANLGLFYERWRTEFQTLRPEVRAACQGLPAVSHYVRAYPSLRKKDIQNLIGKRWFQERVFDIYLWFRGSSG
jgi:hypothetical protein